MQKTIGDQIKNIDFIIASLLQCGHPFYLESVWYIPDMKRFVYHQRSLNGEQPAFFFLKPLQSVLNIYKLKRTVQTSLR